MFTCYTSLSHEFTFLSSSKIQTIKKGNVLNRSRLHLWRIEQKLQKWQKFCFITFARVQFYRCSPLNSRESFTFYLIFLSPGVIWKLVCQFKFKVLRIHFFRAPIIFVGSSDYILYTAKRDFWPRLFCFWKNIQTETFLWS